MTFRRAEVLAATLDSLARQTAPLHSLVVVDNDTEETARQVAAAAGAEYLATGENLGPAGGLAAGILHVLESASENDWVLFLDDDDPPPDDDTIRSLVAIIEAADPALRLGATGLVGARYNPRSGQPERVPDNDLRGPVEVDWIGGGQFPLYSVRAVREVGPPDNALFFGFDDLEYGLRLRRQGWRLRVDGNSWLQARTSAGRTNRSRSELRAGATANAPWRSYYSNRNLLLIASDYGTRRGRAHAAVRSLARAARDGARSETRARGGATALGTLHGLRGVRGRKVEPPG